MQSRIAATLARAAVTTKGRLGWALALVIALAAGARAQVVTYTESFTGAATQNSWYFVNGACLTAGSSASLSSPGQIPSCVTLRMAGNYYNKTIAGTSPLFNNTSEPLVGGNTGTLPDNPAVGGALRFTSAPTVGTWNGSVTNGLFENGGILSNFSFPLSTQGMHVTFTTETYDPGYGPGYNSPTYDGSDGMSFFLQDATQAADIGATGGSLAYTCSNVNSDPTARTSGPADVLTHQRGYDGIPGGYIGLGIDEYGNFLNGALNITGGTTVVENAPTYSGYGPGGWDNSSTGYGWVPNRIGLRGAGSTSWHYLANTWPSYYPTTLTDVERNAAVQQACITGFVWNYSAVTPATANNHAAIANPLYPTMTVQNPYGAVPVSGTKIPYNYAPVPNGNKVLNTVKIANETALYRGTVTPVTNTQYGVPITYDLKITTAGLLTLSYSYNGSAFLPIITNQNIISGNGPLPANVRFGFAGSQGGVPNTHELMCFQAAPEVSSQSSAGLNQRQSAQVQTGTQVYFSFYDPSTWAGSVTSQNLTFNGTDVVISSTANWDASCVLTGVPAGSTCLKTGAAGLIAPQGVDSPKRTILSWNGTTGIPFVFGSLSSAEQAALDTGDGSLTNLRLEYLRGDRTNEQTSSGTGIYRDRASVLGDIIDSSPTWVGPPNTPYPATWRDALDGGSLPENSGQSYAAFTTAAQTRTNVVYTGANDGMLHGFRSGSFSAANTFNSANNDGLEVLAYVPGYIVNNINSSANAEDDYSNPQYGHHFDVDAPPGTGDLFYGGVWHTWLVGGLGQGGSAIYALDITNPANFSEASPTATVIGEWSTSGATSTLVCTHTTANAGNSAAACGQNLGNTYGVPQIRRFHNGQWGAVFGNGFASPSGDAGIYVMLVNSSGIPSFYYLSTGQSGKTDGIAFATPADLDGDHTVDYVYAGDLLGHVWRFDLTSTDPTAWALSSTTPLFSTPAGQPITSKLVVASIVTNPNPHVLVEFGTGQQVPLSNTAGASYSTSQQFLYGVWDWNLAAWNAKSQTQYASLATSPGALAPGNLQLQTISYTTSGGVDYSSVTNTAICWADKTGCTQYGWYVGLSSGHANPSDVNLLTSAASANPVVYEQVIYSPVILAGAFVVNTTIPPTTSYATCSSTTAGGWTYAIDPSTGGAFRKSFFGTNHTFTTIGGLTVSGEALSGTGSPSLVTYNGQSYLVTQNVSGTGTVVEANPPAGTVGSRLTWIEKR